MASVATVVPTPCGNFHQSNHHQIQQKQKLEQKTLEHRCLLESKKLVLVLDLDHTLLNSVTISSLDDASKQKIATALENYPASDKKSVIMEDKEKEIYCFPGLGFCTKLRPGVREFLSKASQLCELHVCTMATRQYANIMVRKILDPSGEIFKGRVISKEDYKFKGFKDLSHKLIMGFPQNALIVDDTIDVWPQQLRNNVLQPQRFEYCWSWSASSTSDEEEEDKELSMILMSIQQIHHKFFVAENIN